MKFKNIVIASALIVSLAACSRVEPNQAGVLMQNYGRNGKSDFAIVVGRVWTAMPGTQLYQVPLWEQRGQFENVLSLKAADNTEFSATPVYSFRVVKERAVDVVFDNKQLGSDDGFIDSLEDNILEPKIYDLMKEESRRYTTDELMAKGGSLMFEQKVQKLVSEEFSKRGLELVTFSSQLEFFKSVTERIDKRNEVNTNISVIDQQIQEQRKRLELAQLQAETNRTLSEGITSQLLQQQMADLTVPESAQGAFNPVQSGQERLGGLVARSLPMPKVQVRARVQKAASTYEQDAQALITGTKSGTVGVYTPLFESDPERIRATRLESLGD